MLLFASVGTDHHPFHRLIDYLDEVARAHPSVRVVVQYGHSCTPAIAEGHEWLTHERLEELMNQADVVVCHGGPGTVMDARRAGHQPICVPRDPSLGEHVDGHQQRFVGTIARDHVVLAPASRVEFMSVIARVLEVQDAAPPARGSVHQEGSGVPALIAELDRLMADPHTARPRRLATVVRHVRGKRL